MSDSEEAAKGGAEADVGTPDAETVIEAFGGIRPMASNLGIAVSTVQGWKARNTIPDNRWRDVIAAADAAGIDLASLTASPAKQDDAETGDVDAQSEDNAESSTPWGSGDGDQTAETTEVAQSADEQEKADAPGEKEPIAEPKPAPARTETSASAVKSSGGSGGGMGWLAFILALVAVLGLLSEPYWRPIAAPHVARIMAMVAPGLAPEGASPALDPGALTAIANRAEELAAQASGLEGKIASVEAAVAELKETVSALPAGEPAPDLSPNLTDIEDRIAALEASLESLATGSAPSGDGAAVSSDVALAAKVASVAGDVESIGQEIEAVSAQASRALSLAEVARDAAHSALSEVEDALNTARGAANDAQQTADDLSVLAELLNDETSALKDAQNELGEAIESQPQIGGFAEAALMLTAGEVSDAIGAGRSYGAARERLAALAVDLPEGSDGAAAAEILIAFADTGVASFESLAREFRTIAPAAHSQSLVPEGDGYWDQALARLSSLVSVRVAGEGPDSPAVSRAEAALARGDLSGAVEIMAAEPGAESGSLGTWLVNAKARLSALSASQSLQAAALERFAGVTGGAQQ